MRISVTSSEPASLADLYQWFTMDRDVVRTSELSMAASGARPGAQSPLDYIDVFATQVVAIANLVIAYKTWRRAAPAERVAPITFKVGEIEVVAKDADDETIERIIAALTAQQANDPARKIDGPPEPKSPS